MNKTLAVIDHQPINHQYLKYLLSEFKYPKNKISKLLTKGDIIALKKGFYILSEAYKCNLSRELVANTLYGPSYVSLEYALAHYGIIPEHVYNLTSVTTAKKKEYYTPIGTFIYHTIKPSYYSTGYVSEHIDGTNYLIATPEKALCDKLYLSPACKNIDELTELMYQNLRIDEFAIKDMSTKLISKIASNANKKNLKLLLELLR